MRKRASRPPHKQVSLFAKRSSMCARENTGRALPSKLSLLAYRKLVERESTYRPRKITRARERYVARPSATCARDAAVAGKPRQDARELRPTRSAMRAGVLPRM